MRRRVSAARLWTALGATLLAGLVVAGLLAHRGGNAASTGLPTNPELDPGTALSGRAPDFTLSDQFGHPVSLRSFRGQVVLLAFNDSECTTICPLTTQAMVQAKELLGAAGRKVALLGVDANPDATSIADVRAYSQAHEMLHQWQFLTGSPDHLKRIWAAYHVQAAIEQGEVDHTPALFVIDPQGRLRRLYMTQQAYSAIGQLGQLLAQEAAGLLPGHPKVASARSYAEVPPIAPTSSVTLPRAGGGSLKLGPGAGPRLLFFFATWTAQTLNLRGQLADLARYQAGAAAAHLPGVTAVDEASVEPSPSPLPALLASLHPSPPFPVAVDQSGRVADGYEVQDQPWLVLVSGSGRFLWYYDVSTAGRISAGELARKVRYALSRAPTLTAPSTAAAQADLAGSPAPLEALHKQASQLLGSVGALKARLRALRGYPVVVNAWASWCGPCQAEFPLFSSASVRYGRTVAFIGADTNDHPDAANAFLAKHPVSYPSYQSAENSDLTAIAPQGIANLPSTLFFNRAGKLVYTHIGQYQSQGSLNGDIEQYALGG